jgi:hypothetical protein
VFIDYLTKWPEAYALPDAMAEAVAFVYVEQIICQHRAPEALLSDRGKQFLSEIMRHMNKFLQVHKVNTTPYHPQTGYPSISQAAQSRADQPRRLSDTEASW